MRISGSLLVPLSRYHRSDPEEETPMSKTRLSLLVAAALSLAACGKSDPPPATSADGSDAVPRSGRVVNFYNWSDYIAEDTLPTFTERSGIRVVYDVFDSNETLEAKLVTGGTGYDIVVPSLSFLGRQIQAGVFKEIDRSKLKNYGNLDPTLMARIARIDPDNTYSVPYLWGTTGIGYHVEKVKEILGEDFEIDSWDVVFKPEIVSRLAACGVTFLDTPTELLPTVLNYLGEDPNSFDEAVIEKGVAVLESVRSHIRYYHSSQYINDLANGDICVAVGWSGDVFQSRDRAEEADRGVTVDYVIPKEGGIMWFDMMAIPRDAKNIDEAYALIDYLLEPPVMAAIQDYVSYASGVSGTLDLIDEGLRNNEAVYPPAEVLGKLFTLAVLPPEVDRIYTRHWTRLKTGR